jgi:peptidoglycan hydrolase-like protein with peptidoglycan-binding domain
MKRIDENQLAARVASLKEKIAEIENAQFDEGIGSAIWNGVKGAGTAIGNALSTTGGKVAAGAALGAGALAAGQALTKPGQAAAPTGTTTKVPGKSDPAILKQQQDLIAKGAKIKADGIMGPATTAAIKQFGGAPAAGTTPPAPAAGTTPPAPAAGTTPPAPAAGTTPPAPAPAAGTTPPAPAPAPAPAPQTSMNTDDEAGAHAFDPTWGGTKAAADTRTGLQKVLPNFMGGKSAPVAANQNATWDNTQQRAVSNQPAPTAESVGFQNDELSRIISLVHHR